jgi:hypothetical protein
LSLWLEPLPTPRKAATSADSAFFVQADCFWPRRSDVTGGSRQLEVPADKINLGFVLGNKVAFGSVNANREYFESGVKDLSTAELQYAGWLGKLLTHEVKGLENYAEMIRLLAETKGAIKVYCNVAAI